MTPPPGSLYRALASIIDADPDDDPPMTTVTATIETTDNDAAGHLLLAPVAQDW